MQDKKEKIAQMKSEGFSNRKIAEILGISRNTVNKIVNDDGAGPKKRMRDETYYLPDFEVLEKELAKPGVTLNLLWEEYCDYCRKSDKLAYKLTQFKKYFHQYLNRVKATSIIEHKAGEAAEVDWAGKRPSWTDPETGKKVYGYLFVGVLSFSGIGFARAYPSMKTECFIDGHIQMYKYFGGVPIMTVCDNLKTGVKENSPRVLELNTVYRDMAEHYGTIIVPTRVRAPRDKSLVENTVKQLTTAIIARLRNYQFFSVDEYNDKLNEILSLYNNAPFKGNREGSRAELYQKYEADALRPLPSIPFTFYEFKRSKVQSNCHICFNRNYYSVPHNYIGKEVTIKVTWHTLEVYDERKLIASHKLFISGYGNYATIKEHLPFDSRSYGEWNSDRYRHWAKTKGPHVYQVVDNIFAAETIEQRVYKKVHDILSLATRYSNEILDKACAYALKLTPYPKYQHIKDIITSGEYLEDEPQQGTQKGRFLRGKAYYER